MRRAIVIAVVVLLLLSVAAVAVAKTDLVRQPKPEQVVAEHIDALNNCDVDRLMAQYPETIHILLPDGVTVEGREAVLALFEGFCLDYEWDDELGNVGGLNGLQFTEEDSWKVHKTLNVQWVADADFLCEPYYGADAYETWSGLMAAQVTTFDGSKLLFVDDPACED